MSRQRANRVYPCVFGDLREETQDRLENFCGKHGIPNAKHGLYLHNELPTSGLHRYALSRDSVPVKSTKRRLSREPTETVTWPASQLTVTPTAPRSPYAGSQDAHHLGQSLTQPIVFPGGQIHRVAGPRSAGCAKPHARIPRPCTRVKERKGRGIHAFCTQPPA